MKKKVEANPCLGHGCYDPDLGCTIPSIDHWFACPLMPDPGPEVFADLERDGTEGVEE
ncbi:hypothetical protein [Subdoligranulum variabile]|uniref:hypothetical protein n=1 Tax=Subdoligranulum variabile TaxID=214851 RepID=UPI0026EDED51|nr:hypothetical protein [Subdoligranulum variabile]